MRVEPRSLSSAVGAAALALGMAACANATPVHGTGGSSGTTSGHGGHGTTTSTIGTGGDGGATASSSGTGGSASSSSSSSSSSSASSSSSSSSSSSGTTSNDPCAGASDGAHCGVELGGLADHGSRYLCSGGQTSSTTPCPSGCNNGACTAPPADPCASAQSGNGAYCGGTLTGGDPNALYNCQNGGTASKTACPAGCQVNPPGVADVCKSTGDPCAGATSGNGAYCGSGLPGGDPNVLYNCQNGSTASQTACNAGCQVNPPGQADTCKPTGGGQCCVLKPPGVLTQSYSACGNGGSHYGVDYGTAVGTPIYAGITGTVVGSALGYPNCYNNGCDQSCWNAFNYVKIKSDCGDPDVAGHDLFVYYLHINDLAPGIANGSHVDQGQLVAHAGNSGCSSGPHIHIETASVPAGQSAVLNTCNSVNPTTRYCN